MALTTIDLQIHHFCNCKGCIKKMKTILGKVGGVELLWMDHETGEVRIRTTKHPQEIQHALEKKFIKVEILSQEISPPIPLYNPLTGDDLAKALETLSRAKGLQSVEHTKSETIKINIAHANANHNEWGSNGTEGVPPSAPPITTTQDQVTGYPTQYHDWSNKDHLHGCCNIL